MEQQDDQDVGRGKEGKEVSGGFEKTDVQGKGETGDRVLQGEEDEGRADQLGGLDHDT